MKKSMLTIGIGLLLCIMTLPVSAQIVNDDNEDGVVKLNADRSRYDYVQGQVLVKFKDENRVTVNASRGQFRSCSVSKLTQVLQKYGTEEMEQLLPSENPSRKMRKVRAYNGETIQERDLSQLYRVRLAEDHAPETMQLVDELKTLEEVEFAEPNYILHTLDNGICDDYSGNPSVDDQWYLNAYGVKLLWEKDILYPTRPVIAIIDTGVDLTHPDLVDNLWTNQAEAEGEAGYDNDNNGFAGDVHGWDFINNTPNIRDNNMHGTHVAGIAAASNNGIGIVGANPLAYIMPVTVMQSDGSGDVATIIKGINYAVQNGATVLNLSLGTYAYSSALRQALERAYQSAVIVAAAGNDHFYNDTECGILARPMFPAAYSFVLGVQATTQDGSLASFSNCDCNGPNYSSMSSLQDPDGYNYEIKAPGTSMLSTIPGGNYKVLQGTSMAAPLVAGSISALLMVKDYTKDDDQIHQEILWGDLLHTDNIAQAFALVNRPAELDILKVQLQQRRDLSEETEDDYIGTYEIKAGDEVSVFPVIRTTFGEASNIRLRLEMGDFEDPNTVQILTGETDFGWNLDAYGKNVSANPLVMKIANDVADARHIRMKVVATCDETQQEFEKEFIMVIINQVMISGLISDDRTLTADHTYYVNENLGILEGVTLTIEPGTRLEFAAGTKLTSWGKLEAKGKPEKPIVFTRHTGEGMWYGINSHRSSGEHRYSNYLYTNADNTLFTLLPTEQTPNQISGFDKVIYYNSSSESNPGKDFYLKDYIEDWTEDMTARQNLLTDPDYLTPAVLQMKKDWTDYYSQYPTAYSSEKPHSAHAATNFFTWKLYDNPRDTISYCRIEGDYYGGGGGNFPPYMKDCVIISESVQSAFFMYLSGVRNTISQINTYTALESIGADLRYTNIVNNNIVNGYDRLPLYSRLYYNNYFNTTSTNNSSNSKYYKKEYWLANDITSTPNVDKSDHPSYLGTSREDIARPHMYEMGNAPDTYGQIDLSNMPTRPYAEAHGIVWKVVVNGYDAQDEYEDLPPLGVGRHKFEVYFNRPMNKAVAPNISFGLRDPYTQQVVAEDGEGSGWNEEGTIYTAYKTITGKTKSDGVNRIYVYGAEDNEYFEIPYEKSRFNINVQAAGSMATGFAAEPKMGRVKLTWNNSHNDFDDAMGFNVYRFNPDVKRTIPRHRDENGKWVEETQVVDTICINKEIVDIETTEYTDYDVTPGQTYYYLYKVLSTDLQEYDVSNVVSAMPLTTVDGDADGSGDVKVPDVITTVNYILGEDPKPFIFEAADMNKDNNVDVLDVIGIIQVILNQPAAARVSIESVAEAVYSIEDGVLYIDTPVELGGLQLQASTNGQPTAAETLKGMEVASAWLTENDYRMLAYSFGSKTLAPGRHAVLTVGDADITSIRLADTEGRNVLAVPGDATAIRDAMGSKVMTTKGVYNLSGQKVMGNSQFTIHNSQLKKGVYIINGEKVVK